MLVIVNCNPGDTSRPLNYQDFGVRLHFPVTCESQGCVVERPEGQLATL